MDASHVQPPPHIPINPNLPQVMNSSQVMGDIDETGIDEHLSLSNILYREEHVTYKTSLPTSEESPQSTCLSDIDQLAITQTPTGEGCSSGPFDTSNGADSSQHSTILKDSTEFIAYNNVEAAPGGGTHAPVLDRALFAHFWQVGSYNGENKYGHSILSLILS